MIISHYFAEDLHFLEYLHHLSQDRLLRLVYYTKGNIGLLLKAIYFLLMVVMAIYSTGYLEIKTFHHYHKLYFSNLLLFFFAFFLDQL